MAQDDKLTESQGRSIIPQTKDRFTRRLVSTINAKKTMVITASGAVLSQLSTYFSWGKSVVDWLQRFDYIAGHNSMSAKILLNLFSPTGANILFILFLTGFFIAVIYYSGHREKQNVLPHQLVDNEHVGEHKLTRGVTDKAPLVKGCSDAHLQEIDSYQRKGLRKYVVVEKCDINPSPLSAGKLYVEFIFQVVNYSMYYVSIPMAEHAVIEGSIYFKGEPLSGAAKLVENRIQELQHYGRNYFTVRQWVNPDEAKDIPETLKTVGNLFDFSRAVVYIKGGDKFPNVETDKIDLTIGMQNAGLENQVIQLEALKSQHEAQISEWRARTNRVYQLSIIYGLAMQAEHIINFFHDSLTQDQLKYLDANINSGIHQCLGAQARDKYYENMPSLPNKAEEQSNWIRTHVGRLKLLIERELQQQPNSLRQ